jgi:hypothetical protein
LVVGGIIIVVLGAFFGGTNEVLQTTKPPWPPEHKHLQQRLDALNLPPVGDESYHIHTLLHVYVDGQPVSVPANIGIDLSQGIEPSLHTEGNPDSITLRVDRHTVEGAPTLANPHAAPDEELQRAAREQCGLGAVPPDP